MEIINQNALFTFDEEGVMIITDIKFSAVVVRGELVYDGKNTIILNRNNKDYFALKNIPPHIRELLLKNKEATIVEQKDEDIYSYLVQVRIVDDLGYVDDWQKFEDKFIDELSKNMTEQEFETFITEAQKLIKDDNK